jgi:hypothetical protein
MMQVPGDDILSPSLVEPGEGEGPAFELKFLVEDAQAREVEAWASARIMLDPHGDPSLGGAYRTTTLYLDTPALDVFHRSPSFKRSKHRLRRYGSEPRVYLERKAKDGDRVRKQRNAIPDEELSLLAAPLSVTTWPGHWFHRRLLDRGLRPSALVVYHRTAYVGSGADGLFRLTLDRRLRGSRIGEWAVPAEEGGLPLLTGQVILELKFRLALPVLFKDLVQSMRLGPSLVSKYRSCVSAWGASAAQRGAADA